MLKKIGVTALVMAALAACEVQTVPLPAQDTQPLAQVTRRGSPQTVSDFNAVVARVEPAAEQTCREMRPGANCDFRIVVERDSRFPPNAYQTLDDNGRPVLGFTQALMRQMVNRDELAFALSHEAAHHIRRHIPQTQRSATTGALLGALGGALIGLDEAGIELAQNLGGTIGARRYSKGFELEADSLGARIAQRAGYDPLRGVLYFQDAADPGDQFLGTHPPNPDRIRVVRQTIGR